MGVRLSSITVDAHSINEGAAIAYWAIPDLELRVRGALYKPYADAVSQAILTARIEAGSDKPIDDDRLAVTVGDLMVEHLLLGWNLTDDEDQPIAFSVDKAKELIRDPDRMILREAVEWCARQVGARRAAVVDDIVGNSQAASDTTGEPAAAKTPAGSDPSQTKRANKGTSRRPNA